MTSKKNKLRAAKMAMRKHKKRPNPLTPEKIEYIDYKDVNLLQRFMSDRSKLRARRMTGTNTQQQRDIATAVKNAREMALLPYTRIAATVVNRRRPTPKSAPRRAVTSSSRPRPKRRARRPDHASAAPLRRCRYRSSW